MTAEQNFRAALSAVNGLASIETARRQNDKVQADTKARLATIWPNLSPEHKSLLSNNATALGLNVNEIFP